MRTLIDGPPTVELVIEEFDQWSSSGDTAFRPTTICWSEPEVEPSR